MKKKIIIALALIITLGVVSFFAISERTVAKVPDPMEFFGNGRKDTGGYDVNLMFESEEDPTELIEEYITKIKETQKNIELRTTDNSYSQEREYVLKYNGFWLGDNRPVLKIYDYRNDYYGEDSDNKNYVFDFHCHSNFKFVSKEKFEEQEKSEKRDNDSQENESAIDTPVVISGPTLPDFSAFLGGIEPRDNEKAKVSGRHLYFRTETDAGWSAAHEYVDLLINSYNFSQTDFKTDTILYLKNDMYFLDYTGKESIAPTQDDYYDDGYVDFSADVFIWIQKNGRDEYTGISIYYSEDLEVKDFGDRASSVPENSGSSSKGSSTAVDYETPDFAKLKCLTCDGKKDCTRCNGYGTIKRYNGNGETIDSLCPTCYGNRKCKACNGTGTR